MKVHGFKINELDRNNGRQHYLVNMRRFLHLYWKGESKSWDGHIEYSIKKKLDDHLFSARFHIGNAGSETPWDGHLCFLWFNFYWGHTGFRKLAEFLTRCSGYKYDSREWSLKIFDGRLWWEIANHSDMCDKRKHGGRVKRQKRRRNSWRRGSINLSVPEAIWGPRRYTYEDKDVYQALLKFPDGEYAVILTLQRVLFGRTKVDKSKHEVSWSVDVDAPRGIPTHVDHSGGWKGDRTHGFGVKIDEPGDDWEVAAVDAVIAWVNKERKRTGFVAPDPVES